MAAEQIVSLMDGLGFGRAVASLDGRDLVRSIDEKAAKLQHRSGRPARRASAHEREAACKPAVPGVVAPSNRLGEQYQQHTERGDDDPGAGDDMVAARVL